MIERLVAAAVVTLAAAGVALRIWIFNSDLGALDADEAVWGTMARRVLDGELTAFFWGQGYGGTHEVIPTAAVFALVGTSVEALRAVPLLLFATAALLTWRVGIRTVGEPCARLGAATFWVWSGYVVWKSTRAHGFYGAALVLGLVVVLLCLRLAEQPERRDALLLGLALGLGFWATPQVLLLALPTLGWLAWRRRGLPPHGVLVAAAAVAGALPWLVANATHDWYSLTSTPQGGSAVDRVHNLLVATLPSALGARLPFTLGWVGGVVVGLCLYAALAGAAAWMLLRRRRDLGPLVPMLVIFPAFYAFTPYASLNTEPRYLVVLGPLLALLVVAAPGTPSRALAVAFALLALTVVGLGRLERGDAAVARSDGLPVPADLDPLLSLLEAQQVRHAYADYWLAWRIVFESGERVIAVPEGVPPAQSGRGRRSGDAEKGRYPRFFDRVAAAANPAYVYLHGGATEAVARPRLVAAGYHRLRAERFVVYVRGRRE